MSVAKIRLTSKMFVMSDGEKKWTVSTLQTHLNHVKLLSKWMEQKSPHACSQTLVLLWAEPFALPDWVIQLCGLDITGDFPWQSSKKVWSVKTLEQLLQTKFWDSSSKGGYYKSRLHQVRVQKMQQSSTILFATRLSSLCRPRGRAKDVTAQNLAKKRERERENQLFMLNWLKSDVHGCRRLPS